MIPPQKYNRLAEKGKNQGVVMAWSQSDLNLIEMLLPDFKRAVHK